LGGLERGLVEMVDDVLRDVLLRPREVLEAGADVRRQSLALATRRLGAAGALSGRPVRADCLLHRQACHSTPARGVPSHRPQPTPWSCSWFSLCSASTCATTYRISTFTSTPMPTNVISRAIVWLVAASAVISIGGLGSVLER